MNSQIWTDKITLFSILVSNLLTEGFGEYQRHAAPATEGQPGRRTAQPKHYSRLALPNTEGESNAYFGVVCWEGHI